MDRAARKLHSSRGAAMVLALVFLLVCVTIGASVLAAAASNAGRSNSNRQEQQLYLALSSAMKLVTDDLADASYIGQITYTKTTDSASGITTHTIDFADGKMDACTFESLFREALDLQFDAYICDELKGLYPGGHNDTYNYPTATTPAGPVTFTLTVQPEGDMLKDYTAQIAVEVDQTFRISLSARLTQVPETAPASAKDSYVLTTVLSPQSLPTLTLPTGSEYTNEIVKVTDPLTWTADRILRPAPTTTP